jgi:hypothetical protein
MNRHSEPVIHGVLNSEEKDMPFAITEEEEELADSRSSGDGDTSSVTESS